MIVNVVGVKHVNGTSKKSGKEFNAFIVSYTRDGRSLGFDGLAAGEIFADCSLFKGVTPKAGDCLMVDRNGSGFVESIEFIDG